MIKRILCLLIVFFLMLSPCGISSLSETTTEEYESATQTTLLLTTPFFDNNDEEYIVKSNALYTFQNRYCDAQRELIYCFDLSHLKEPSLYFQISQNYLVQVSTDGSNFETVANYMEDKGNGIAFDGTSPNHITLCIDGNVVDFSAPVYVRLANCNPSGSLGGAISAILIRSQVEDTTKPVVKSYGDVNNDNGVNAADALQCLQHSVKLHQLEGRNARAADVNADSSIDAVDALLILQKSVQLISNFPAEMQSPILEDGSRLLFLGDSITDGGRDWESPDDLGYGYVARIQSMLSGLYPERDFTIINRGYSGWTSSQMHDILQKDCIDQNPDVVTLLIGINDVVLGQVNGSPVDPAVYEYNLRCIMEEIQKTGARVIFLSPFALPSNYTDGWHEADLNAKIAVAQIVAEDTGAVFVPMDSIFHEQWIGKNYTGALSSDGVHPLESGVNILAGEWIKAFESFGGNTLS